MAAWKFFLAELPVSATATTGSTIGEMLNAYEKKASLPLDGLHQASCRLRRDDDLVTEILTRDFKALGKVYDDSTLRFIGQLTGFEEDSDTQSVSLTFAGPLWRLSKRLMGASTAGYQRLDTARDAIVDEVLFASSGSEWSANRVYDTGIRKGTFDSLELTSVGEDSPLQYKPISELLTEMQTAKTPPYDTRDNFGAHTYVDINEWLTGSTPNAGAPACLDGKVTQFPGASVTWEDPSNPTTDALKNSSFCVYDENGFRQVGRLAFDTPSGDFQFLLRNPESTTANWTQTVDLGAKNVNVYVRHGLCPRYDLTGGAAWIVVVSVGVGDAVQVQALKRSVAGGGWTSMGTAITSLVWTAGDWLSLQTIVNSSGDWQVFVSNATTAVSSPQISGTDAALAAGGTLGTAAGAHGLVDAYQANSGATSTTIRFWDNYKAWNTAGDLTSFDFEFVPSEPTADSNQSGVVGNGVKIATMNLRQSIGTDRTATVVLEYGGSGTLRSFKRSASWDGLLTRAHALPPDLTAGPPATETDADAFAALGLYEDTVPNNVSSTILRAALARANVEVRKQARQIIQFSLAPNAPVFGTDYFVGDTVTARIYRNDELEFAGTVRVYGIEYSSDNEGKESIEPILVPT